MSEPVQITVHVNGVQHTARVEPRLLLVDLIREELRLTGTHVGCDDGVCGACTVELDGETVKSCLLFAVQADGARITTVEGVNGPEAGARSPLQECFIGAGAIQCGYCTPGMVMSARALLSACPHPAEEDIRAGMLGNLCRCGGYQKIVAAVLRAAADGDGAPGTDPTSTDPTGTDTTSTERSTVDV
jgi:carbon-monoxide dehydrogenase small subunit